MTLSRFIQIITFCLMMTQMVCAGQHIQDQKLWKHVVTVDRLAWQERDGEKQINKRVNDFDFVRRLYLDVTGKIPTYGQMVEFLNDKAVNKREKLIERLLASPGYTAHYSTFWLDLLRNPYRGAENFRYKEYVRFTERFLTENWSYDKIVKTLLMANGSVNQNPAIGFYCRDSETDFMDTFNATTRVFLGTRLGCAQCHNHRFDKWTQKEFYEASAHLFGVSIGEDLGRRVDDYNSTHVKAMMADKRFSQIVKSGGLPSGAKRIFYPSSAKVTFSNDGKKTFKYPETYAYDNAKPGEEVKARLVFGYGPEKVEGESPREKFANWMTSKENPMFARVMPNRLWKRIMGYANMEPIDDYKDTITIQNKKLFEALGDVFIDLNYNIKGLLSVIFNSEAYQYAYDPKNNFEVEDYRVQGVKLKRMSAQQLNDSLKTLRYGDLDRFAKVDAEYFEYEDKINELAQRYKDEFIPLYSQLKKQKKDEEYVDSSIVEKMFAYVERYKEIEDYYQILPSGYIKGREPIEISSKGIAPKRGNKKMEMMANTKMGENMMGSMTHGPTIKKGTISRANHSNSDFMMVFGALDRSAPESTVETGATMKQILKMMNSKECQEVVAPDSYMMKNMMSKTKLSDRINYLYYSMFSRTASSKEQKIAAQFLGAEPSMKTWSKYALALLNSPEFYFIK